jgi:hypothetical protein
VEVRGAHLPTGAKFKEQFIIDEVKVQWLKFKAKGKSTE